MSCSQTCLKGAVVVGLIAALTPGLWAQPRAQERTTPDGQTIAPGAPAEAQRTPTARGSMLSDTIAPEIGTTAPPTAAAGGFLLDNGSMNFTGGRTVGAGSEWQVFQPFTVPAPGWAVTTIGTDGWNVTDPNGSGILGRLLPDVGGNPDEANPISSAVYFLQPNAGQSSWRDEAHNVALSPGNYWMQWTNNGDPEHWSAIFLGVSGEDSFSRNSAGDEVPFGPTALRIAGQVQGGLIWFFDRAAFEAFNAGEGKVLKGIEDYEESILGPNAIDGFNDSLESGVPNLPDGFPFPVGMTGLPNLIVQSNFEHTLFNPNPRGVDGLAAVSIGLAGAASDSVVADTFVDSLDLIFTDEKSGVGFNTISFLGANAVEVNVFSTTNVFLGMMTAPADPSGTNFIGVFAPVPILRVNIWDPGGGAEGADNIQAWQEGNPCPADFDLSGAVDVKDLLFLLGAWGPCPPGPPPGACPADFDNSGAVDVKDLLFLLGAWGPCP